ncbi:MAG: type II toxin-antitoxin system PemK/MazF family toxin [Cytophagales bacterium]|nr:MAG: type II toxin-antitoxin system PemK/MazF family toxin [Cytophagales bacterium]
MNRGEIWRINLDPTVGAEIQKTRPAIIINDDNLGILPLRVIIPLTDWKDRYVVAPWMVQVRSDETNNLSKDSAADCFQVRSVSINRFVKKIGEVDGVVIAAIEISLMKVLKIDS